MSNEYSCKRGQDALTGGKPLLTEQEIPRNDDCLQNEMRVKQEVVARKKKSRETPFSLQ